MRKIFFKTPVDKLCSQSYLMVSWKLQWNRSSKKIFFFLIVTL